MARISSQECFLCDAGRGRGKSQVLSPSALHKAFASHMFLSQECLQNYLFMKCQHTPQQSIVGPKHQHAESMNVQCVYTEMAFTMSGS